MTSNSRASRSSNREPRGCLAICEASFFLVATAMLLSMNGAWAVRAPGALLMLFAFSASLYHYEGRVASGVATGRYRLASSPRLAGHWRLHEEALAPYGWFVYWDLLLPLRALVIAPVTVPWLVYAIWRSMAAQSEVEVRTTTPPGRVSQWLGRFDDRLIVSFEAFFLPTLSLHAEGVSTLRRRTGYRLLLGPVAVWTAIVVFVMYSYRHLGQQAVLTWSVITLLGYSLIFARSQSSRAEPRRPH